MANTLGEIILNVDDYQIFTSTTAIYPDEQALEYLALGLASEAGEVAGKIKKKIRDGGFDVAATADEVGDVLWYCARLLDELGVSMSEALAANKRKLCSRKERGTLQGSGDTR